MCWFALAQSKKSNVTKEHLNYKDKKEKDKKHPMWHKSIQSSCSDAVVACCSDNCTKSVKLQPHWLFFRDYVGSDFN
jgi:hypothetical protein